MSGDGIELAVFGSSEPENTPSFPFQARYLGRLQDDISLRILYSATDVIVVPSKQEAFGQTATESMACGTPVVFFDATGPKDIVDHKVTGYKARPFQAQDLAKGINWVLNHPDPARLSEEAREKVMREFDSNVVAGRYIRLYEEVLGN